MTNNLDDSVHNNRIPQFRIVDLLVLTTSFAVGLAIQEALVNLGFKSMRQTDYGWFNVVSRTVFAATSGLPLAAIYLLAINRRYSGKTLMQPGHWLLVSMLCLTIECAFRILGAVVPHDLLYFQLDGDQVNLVLSAFFSLASAAILIWAGKRNSGSWRKVLFLFAFCFILWSAFYAVIVFFESDGSVTGNEMFVLDIIGWVESLLNLVIAIFLSVLAIVEFRHRVRRDLWHWLGVFVGLLVVTAVPMIGFMYSVFGLWTIE